MILYPPISFPDLFHSRWVRRLGYRLSSSRGDSTKILIFSVVKSLIAIISYSNHVWWSGLWPGETGGSHCVRVRVLTGGVTLCQSEDTHSGVTLCQSEGTHQIVMVFSPPVEGCLLKKYLQKRGPPIATSLNWLYFLGMLRIEVFNTGYLLDHLSFRPLQWPPFLLLIGYPCSRCTPKLKSFHKITEIIHVTWIRSRDGAVVRARASHQCGPGSIPPGVISWVCCWFTPCSEGFSQGLRFSFLHKNQHFQILIRPG